MTSHFANLHSPNGLYNSSLPRSNTNGPYNSSLPRSNTNGSYNPSPSLLRSNSTSNYANLSQNGDLASPPPPPYSSLGRTNPTNKPDIKETLMHMHDDPDHLDDAILDLDGELPRLVKEMDRRAKNLVPRIFALAMILFLTGAVILVYAISFLSSETEVPRKWAVRGSTTKQTQSINHPSIRSIHPYIPSYMYSFTHACIHPPTLPLHGHQVTQTTRAD